MTQHLVIFPFEKYKTVFQSKRVAENWQQGRRSLPASAPCCLWRSREFPIRQSTSIPLSTETTSCCELGYVCPFWLIGLHEDGKFSVAIPTLCVVAKPQIQQHCG